MSWLAPLYLAGLLAVSLPVIFHLIRRTPRGRMPFSSLMFLSPSPPRLTRRSRLDNRLLLLLRGLVLVLLTLAFMRPFLRESALLDIDAARGRRVAILVDTSASMQRGDMWQQATAKVKQLMAELQPADRVTLLTFDREVRPLFGFDEAATVPPAERLALLADRLSRAAPTFKATNLGAALVTTADMLDAKSDEDETEIDAVQQILLITDLQRGSDLRALDNYQWPEQVRIEVHLIAPQDASNAGLQQVASEMDSTAVLGTLRIRVHNEPGSASEQFTLAWRSGSEPIDDREPLRVYVPAGESRVVKIPPPPQDASADRLVLDGDREPFDNTLYIAAAQQTETTVVYLGTGPADDPKGLLYYLQRAFSGEGRRKVRVAAWNDASARLEQDTGQPPMVVAAGEISQSQIRTIKRLLDRGGTLLYVVQDDAQAASLAAILERPNVSIEEVDDRDYTMLGQITFSHPLFAAFADPRYSDFTKIHFWRYRRIVLDDQQGIRVLARFEGGDPALIEQKRAKGRVLVLASGWHPADSQLALSTKFVPLLSGMIDDDNAQGPWQATYQAGDHVSLPVGHGAVTASIRPPDGSELKIAAAAKTFDSTGEPGIYEVNLADGIRRFAVNLAPQESRTAPLELDQLQQYGIRLGGAELRAVELERNRQMRDQELERRQKLWRWLIVAALGVLILETLLAARWSRPATPNVPEAP